MCETDDTEDQGPQHGETVNPNPRNVLDAFDTIRSFLGAHDDDVAMDHFLQCENRTMKLLQGKARQTKLTDFWQ